MPSLFNGLLRLFLTYLKPYKQIKCNICLFIPLHFAERRPIVNNECKFLRSKEEIIPCLIFFLPFHQQYVAYKLKFEQKKISVNLRDDTVSPPVIVSCVNLEELAMELGYRPGGQGLG